MVTANYSHRTYGGPEVFTHKTIVKRCGVKTSSGRQERYILIKTLGVSSHIQSESILQGACFWLP